MKQKNTVAREKNEIVDFVKNVCLSEDTIHMPLIGN